MQVAVARVEYVGDGQIVLAPEFLDAPQHQRQVLARDGSVRAVVVGRNAAHRGKRHLASGPESRPFGFVARHARRTGAAPRHDRAHPLDVVGDRFGGAVQFAQKDRGCVDRITAVDERLGGADRRVVHHLEARRHDAGGNHRAHRGASLFHVGERGQHDARGFGFRNQLDGDFDDHAEHPFRAGRERQQVETRRIQRIGTEGQ